MNFRKLVLVTLMVMLAAFMVACGGDDDGGDNGGVNLSQEATSTIEGVGTLTAAYPDGWVSRSEDDGSLAFASSDAVMEKIDASDASPEKGEAAAMVMYVSGADMGDVMGVFRTVGTPGKRDHQSRNKGVEFTIHCVLTRRAEYM